MNESLITLQGWLGSDVTLRRAGDTPVASFRLACTPRRFNRRTENWSDGTTQWYTVNVWRQLAENCAASLRRGDPVVVHGRLEVRLWVNSDNVEVTSFEIDAAHLGHDLTRGTSTFTRNPPRERTAETVVPDAPGEEVAA
ncbi:single-stranded DNA-binding protein [Nocardioides sp. T2.26MG-1]|uniref:single-stranded DNA-binding protein n=1 Tax=Nocardioides sp. T2.26MG-1 TaxID=3041166 RepID=UPI0024773CCB|nr:single-stranded DNA-binding protein [Nocardioides sp. T2.26MG-1]CAI9408545.1 Single-stranded DNA-binding protein 1 [Nocardioides sp. T2.26MG-1]